MNRVYILELSLGTTTRRSSRRVWIALVWVPLSALRIASESNITSTFLSSDRV
jgi:hypothetical protein